MSKPVNSNLNSPFQIESNFILKLITFYGTLTVERAVVLIIKITF